MKIRIKNGRVIDPKNNEDSIRDLIIKNGKILDHRIFNSEFDAELTIDASNYVVCPGLVDLQARLREPGEEHKATMNSELSAAISGGITSVCVPPDTDPVIDTPAMVQMIRQRGRRLEKARVYPLGALTADLAGERLTDMAALRDAGCTALSNGDRSIDNTLVMRRAMQYASTFDLTVFLNALDPWLKGNGCVHEGEISTRLGLPAIPEAAEVVALARELALIETTGARAHITQLSCARSVEKISEAKARGLKVTSAVSAHHLHLDESDIGEFDTRCHVIPPFRSVDDRNALRGGLKTGVIDAVCSDHQPHGLDAKLTPFSESAIGISGLETLLSLTIQLVKENTLSLNEAIRAITYGPSQILNIAAGTLDIGSEADICIFDLDSERTLNIRDLVSQGKNTPFAERKLFGDVIFTLVEGQVVYKKLIT